MHFAHDLREARGPHELGSVGDFALASLMSVGVTLSRPLKTHDGEVSEIKLKEPTARSFFSHGEPFKVNVLTDDKGESLVDFTFFNNVFAKFLVDMTGHDDIVLSSLRAVDYVNVRTRAAHMIIGVAGTNPT